MTHPQGHSGSTQGPRQPVVKRRRPRHQVVVQLMPGAEPWLRVETGRGSFKLPATCSLLELWELLQGGYRANKAGRGELLVRVPLRMLSEPPSATR
jgi:hypothetical protein